MDSAPQEALVLWSPLRLGEKSKVRVELAKYTHRRHIQDKHKGSSHHCQNA